MCGARPGRRRLLARVDFIGTASDVQPMAGAGCMLPDLMKRLLGLEHLDLR